jgi:hypothetical protein
VKGWERVATSDPDQIRAWWMQWPDANVGIHCDGMLVIDVDPKKGGFESLAALEKEIELEATYEVETPSGGRHIYYRCEASVRNGVDIYGPGLDVRTTNGYVVAPGSRLATGAYRVVADEPIAGADARLVERAAARAVQERAGVRDAIDTDVEAAVLRAVDYLRTHPVAIEGQGGDHHTFRTICRIRDFGVPQEKALTALEDWNASCQPPWDTSELEVKIANAYQYAQDAPGKLTPEAMGFEAIEPETPAEDKPKKSSVTLKHPADILDADVLKIAYHVKGVLEKESDAVLFGTWNVGKTFVVIDMAASVACGLPWFGRRVTQGKVLYVGYEGSRAMQKRMWALREKYPQLKNPETPFRYHAMTDPLTLKSGYDELKEVLAEFARLHGTAPDLLIIDTLAAALGGDDSDADKMAELNRIIKVLIKKLKCTVLRVHHTGHGNQERARGHSSLPAGIDTEIRVDQQEIALTKQRDDVRSKAGFRLTVTKVGTDSDGDPVTTCVVEHIEENALDPKLTGPEHEYLDKLVALRGEGGFVSQTDVKDCAPEDMPPAKRRVMLAHLEKKLYLRAEGKGWIICERGPASMFD